MEGSFAARVLRKSQLLGLLEEICQDLELTESQFRLAEKRYQAVGSWLAESTNPIFRDAVIYPQGSAAIGTTVRPPRGSEHDVDLITLLVWALGLAPGDVKRAVGNRLREHGDYRSRLEEKNRCWRLVYAREFHLDITPSVPNRVCTRGGELVPDKAVSRWKPSNPKGLRALFEARALLQPRIATSDFEMAKARAQVEALPLPTRFKGPLRRFVQILKRHRDIHFDNEKRGELAPLSVIITTLASKAYEACARSGAPYDTELDVLLDVLRRLPDFILVTEIRGVVRYEVPNETTEGENFAERWNEDPRLAPAFYSWHRQAVADLDALLAAQGVDGVGRELGRAMGPTEANSALRKLEGEVSAARDSGRLSVVSGIGLTSRATSSAAIPQNTFFGRQ